jgi:hypothetical protein
VRHGPHQGAQTSTRTGMVLRPMWRSNISALTSLGMPDEHLGPAFPAFRADDRTRRWQAIDSAAFAADREIFRHFLLSSSCAPDSFTEVDDIAERRVSGQHPVADGSHDDGNPRGKEGTRRGTGNGDVRLRDVAMAVSSPNFSASSPGFCGQRGNHCSLVDFAPWSAGFLDRLYVFD